jgi:copper oxidase (laccase) domain-containing protein
VLGGCTACDPGLSSYRRDGDRAGRQWSMVVTSRATA